MYKSYQFYDLRARHVCTIIKMNTYGEIFGWFFVFVEDRLIIPGTSAQPYVFRCDLMKFLP